MTQTYDTKPGVKIPGREDSLPKRFYQTVTVEAMADGFAILLDGRAVKTPARQSLSLPTQAAADLVAAEWAVQGERIDAPNMPATRLVFVALDRVSQVMDETRAEIVKYASTDLLCFRAPEPAELVAAQSAAWDPLLGWAEEALDAHFTAAQGLMPIDQDPVALSQVLAAPHGLDHWTLTCLAHATAVCGSAILGLALLKGRINGVEAFTLSTLDEHFQISQWGEDHEAAERLARLKTEMEQVDALLRALAAQA